MLVDAIVGHLVGDYLLQNDWMAAHKKLTPGWYGRRACAVHCLLWSLSVMLFSQWFLLPWRMSLLIFAVLFVAHFAQDRTTIITDSMKRFGQEDFAYGRCSPWSVIVVDNVWHIVTLWGVQVALRYFGYVSC